MASLVEHSKMNLADKLSILDKIADKVNSKHGKPIVGRIGQNKEILNKLKIKFIPTPSYELNCAIGGGIPRRRCTIITGIADSGKTSLALETIAFNMKKDPDFVAIWLESESSLEEQYITNTFGIDPNRFFYIEADSKKPAEEILDLLYSVLSTGAADICVINSLKCLLPQKEREASLVDSLVANQARMNARLARKFTAMVAEYDTAFVIIQHLSTEVGSMSRDPLSLSGGLAIKYWSSLTLDLRKRTIAENEPISKDEGVKIAVSVKKNHCIPWKNPYVKLVYYAVFGQGIEQVLSALTRACEQGRAEIKGAWVYFKNKQGEVVDKWNGRQAFRQYMLENPDEFNKFLQEIDSGIEAMNDEEINKIKEEDKILTEIENNTESEEKTNKSTKKAG